MRRQTISDTSRSELQDEHADGDLHGVHGHADRRDRRTVFRGRSGRGCRLWLEQRAAGHQRRHGVSQVGWRGPVASRIRPSRRRLLNLAGRTTSESKGDSRCRLFGLPLALTFLWHLAQSAGALTLNDFLPSWQAPQNLPAFMSFMVNLSLPFFISNSLGLVWQSAHLHPCPHAPRNRKPLYPHRRHQTLRSLWGPP